MASAQLPPPIADWFARRGWAPRSHQLGMLEKARAGEHALLIAPTGGGKTLGGFLPSLVDLSGAHLALGAGNEDRAGHRLHRGLDPLFKQMHGLARLDVFRHIHMGREHIAQRAGGAADGR